MQLESALLASLDRRGERRLWSKASNFNRARSLARLKDFVGRLHSHQRLHFWPKRLFDPNCHVTSQVHL